MERGVASSAWLLGVLFGGGIPGSQRPKECMVYMGVSKNRGKTPKMDGENNGNPYEKMDDLGGKPTIFGNTHIYLGLIFMIHVDIYTKTLNVWGYFLTTF